MQKLQSEFRAYHFMIPGKAQNSLSQPTLTKLDPLLRRFAHKPHKARKDQLKASPIQSANSSKT